MAFLTAALRFLWTHPAVALAAGVTLWLVGDGLEKQQRPGAPVITALGTGLAGIGAVSLVSAPYLSAVGAALRRAPVGTWGVGTTAASVGWRTFFWPFSALVP